MILWNEYAKHIILISKELIHKYLKQKTMICIKNNFFYL